MSENTSSADGAWYDELPGDNQDQVGTPSPPIVTMEIELSEDVDHNSTMVNGD